MFFAEGEALEIYREAGCDPASPVSPEELARGLLGAAGILEQAQPITSAAWCNAHSRLLLRPGVAGTRRSWLLAHELAERHLSRLNYRGADVEAFANRIAASLIAPAPAVRLALRALGQDYAALAEVFDTTQSVMALRIGEVTGQPTALVTRTRVHIRGDEWCWPDEAELRAILARPANSFLPAKTRLLRLQDSFNRLFVSAP